MNVEVAYAERDAQILVSLDLASGATVLDALRAAKNELPQIDIDSVPIGIFGQICTLDQKLRDWDRVEIYRPLVMDAKEARRQRALDQQKSSV